MSCGSSDNDVKLIRDYRYLLSYIRPLIQQLDKSRDAQLCLLWLSKLDQCSRWEKSERNVILSHLCQQVKDNYLEPPFNSPPPPGLLRNILVTITTPPAWRVNETSDLELDMTSEGTVSSNSPQTINCVQYQNEANAHVRQCSPWRKQPICPKVRKRNSWRTIVDPDHSKCYLVQKNYEERAESDRMVIQRYQEIIRSLLSQQVKNVDNSPSKINKLHDFYESKISALNASLKVADDEKNALRLELEKFAEESEDFDKLKNFNNSLQERINNLESSSSYLEAKCHELEGCKTQTLHDMKVKHDETELKLQEAEEQLKLLEKEYEDKLESEKMEHQKQIHELEKKYTNELANLERTLAEKENETGLLKEQVKTQCSHFEDEVTRLKENLLQNSDIIKERKKVKILKNKTRQLEKTRENLAMFFQAQLQQILVKKDLHIAALEMKLKASRCEVGVNVIGSEIREILNERVADLEEQYRLLLQEAGVQAATRRQMDLQKIHELEKQLLATGKIMDETENNSCDFKLTEL